jgi:hypothetical protein
MMFWLQWAVAGMIHKDAKTGEHVNKLDLDQWGHFGTMAVISLCRILNLLFGPS